jgi:hypothetical protein
MFFKQLNVSSVLLLFLFIFNVPVALADDADDLTTMLHEFLAGAGDAAAHERFWAEELVYTSSSGTRTSKAEIMQGFDAADNGDSEDAGLVYTGEDIQIQIYDTTAVVTFRLVATPAEGSGAAALQNYFNTGTFLKRDGMWRAVAWQATKIPGP